MSMCSSIENPLRQEILTRSPWTSYGRLPGLLNLWKISTMTVFTYILDFSSLGIMSKTFHQILRGLSDSLKVREPLL